MLELAHSVPSAPNLYVIKRKSSLFFLSPLLQNFKAGGKDIDQGVPQHELPAYIPDAPHVCFLGFGT